MSKSSQADPPLVSLQNVCKHYRDGDVRALDQISMDIHSGEFISIMGPSGCGKSTLLNMIGALDRPTSGEVFFGGQPLSKIRDIDQLRAQQIGFVFQSFYLLPNLTAQENIQIPMFESNRSRSGRASHAAELLAKVGLPSRANHLPSQLSMGQRQRVAIARALANEPRLILADEPTGALDSQSGVEIMELLSNLNASDNTTLIVVTHDPRVADRAGRVIHMRDGRIENTILRSSIE
jgi:ABC-type lipoprotein export system ATPase subunit